MKINAFLLTLALLVCISCDQHKSEEKYKVKNYFTDTQRDSLLVTLVPYFADMLVGMEYKDRFDSTSREKFKKILFNWSFERYYIDKDSNCYFIISELAPSAKVDDKIAIGGRYKLTSDGKIVQYEELFNTYKMPPEKLSKTSDLLMDEMVSKNGDVSKYIGDGETIEFPDAHVCYDKEKLKWKVCVPY